MTKHFYIENDEECNAVGTVGFLVERKNPYRPLRRPVRKLSDRPADNVSTYTRGVAQVIAVYANGRARVRTLHGIEAVDALAKLGWSDLSEEAIEAVTK